MKKVVIITVVILLIVGGIGTGCYFYKKHHKKTSSTTYYHTLTYQTFKKMVDDKKTFILVIHQTGCSHCANYLPIVESISNEFKLDVYNINTANFNEEDRYKFNGTVHYSGTPTTIFFFDGVEKTPLNRIVGEASKATTVERYKSLGFISE